ncbi:MAG: GTP cyclohydrolase II [Flavobacteriales bacterium]|nr:GTP cyclohydrolase II [Flavobacteriales bacterium]
MLKNQAQAEIPTDWGKFTMIAYSEKEDDWMPHLVMIHEKTDFTKTVPVRFHSECITGDIFHSKRCECGKQLHSAMDYFSKNGGILIYLRQEGRNIGIINKLKAYNLQDKGRNTVEANLDLGLPADGRSFNEVIEIMNDLKVKSIFLLTNNPEKIKAIEKSSIVFKGRIPLEIQATKENEAYLKTKKEFFKHKLNIE